MQTLLAITKEGRMEVRRQTNMMLIFKKEGNLDPEYQNTSSEMEQDQERPEWLHKRSYHSSDRHRHRHTHSHGRVGY